GVRSLSLYDALPICRGWSVNAGLRGMLVGDWTWQVAGTFSEDFSRTLVDTVDMAALIARLASSDTSYAFNPFGDATGNSPDVMRSEEHTSELQSREK